MNKYLEKIAEHQEPVTDILLDHAEKYYEIEDGLEDHMQDFDRVHNVYKHNTPEDPYRYRLVNEIRQMREDKLRDELDIEGQHHQNNLETAKRLMDLKGMSHLVNDDNASNIVRQFEKAHDSYSTNPSAIWKNLGTMAAVAGGAALGGLTVASNYGKGPGVLGGMVAGAIGGGYLGRSTLGNMLDHKIKARDEANYEAREHAIQVAFDRLKTRYSIGH